MIGDAIGIFVRGHVRMVNAGPGEADAIRHYWIEVYHSSLEEWVGGPGDMRYFEIVPTLTFGFGADGSSFIAASLQRRSRSA